MITKEQYEESLNRLIKKEKEHKLAMINGASFMQQYKDALKLSKGTNKLILILFHVTGCDGCLVTEYALDHSEQIKEALSDYIVLRYNVSNIRTGLTTKYNIYSYPTLLIINHEEKIIKQKNTCKVLDGVDRGIISWLVAPIS